MALAVPCSWVRFVTPECGGYFMVCNTAAAHMVTLREIMWRVHRLAPGSAWAVALIKRCRDEIRIWRRRMMEEGQSQPEGRIENPRSVAR